jgi:hypothetical protein
MSHCNLIAFVVFLCCVLESNAECLRPSQPDIAGEQYKALQKRAAYAAFLADECGFENDIQKKYSSLVKMAFDDSVETQQRNISDFKSRKKEFSDDASFLGVKKRCIIETRKTRALVTEVSDDISDYMDVIASMRRKYHEKMDEWSSCQIRQQAAEEAAKAAADEEAYKRSEEYARKKAVEDVEAGFRGSLMDEGTAVLTLRNASNQTADFQLRCYQTNGHYKTFLIALSPGNSTEIGFLEGWPGNFVSGEYCEALYRGESLWKITKR